MSASQLLYGILKMPAVLHHKVFYHSPQRGYPAEFADLTLNYHEFIGTPNQSIRMKMFPKKYVY
jgi:hypothetical protein